MSGQVVNPGLVHLTEGARVDDAIAAAGGPTSRADLAELNLARVMSDGEQIHVPEPGEEPPREAGPSTTDGSGPSGTPEAMPLDLNRADPAELEALPGIGPVTAGRIVAHREQIGGFVDVTQLLEVPGIGPARLAELQRVVRIGP
ncbi:helix-hairpin-helix domain-containing protein [Euzebya tangerina]|uniref:helix-hairpin-helix domain-containing protein n=1 Tax=Euzebya tangerina TaxID=591198 RepID=UPI0013C32651|nr:helix-hairpin-helix domain-containing protein [Euzebya tangerina]